MLMFITQVMQRFSVRSRHLWQSSDMTQDASGLTFRRPSIDDHLGIVTSIPEWWGTPNSKELPLLLPRLFIQHFADTSTVAEDQQGALAGFLIGFISQSRPEVGYIHFVGVRPDQRGVGLARTLYEKFFEEARSHGCSRVEAATSILNLRSQDFHRAMGFKFEGDTDFDGALGWFDYDGPEQHRVSFVREV